MVRAGVMELREIVCWVYIVLVLLARYQEWRVTKGGYDMAVDDTNG